MTQHDYIQYDYIKDPKAIYAQSFATLREEVDFERFPANMHMVITRLIHSCGMVDIADDVAYSENFINSAQMALQNGAPILCDCEMVKSGIIKRLLPADNQLICTLNDDATPSIAAAQQTTRSAAAVKLWLPHINGAVVVIGNAPTSLFRLLEMLSETDTKPAAIIGFPVGFVGAVESKNALIASELGIEYIALKGRRGGSAMASAVLNAVAGGLG
ncbi:MAG: precorrin-8X methylmutase [Hyphomicrobiales bacterium]|nr:MAG: precorrin-8X methylmutase [Hyphomicrobiales bacterium]